MSVPPTDSSTSTSYRFTDRSLVRPALTRWWFARLFPLLPRRLAANFVTLLSTGSLLVVLALSVEPARWNPAVLALVFFVTMQLYVAGDHLDGMQAVASGTASPLGDFLDHYCDLWAGCILVFGFWSLIGTAGLGVLLGMEVLLILGFAVTFVEREERRALHFTRYGTLEAIVILSAFFLSWAVPPVRAWWQSAPVVGMPWYSGIVMIGATMAIGAIAVIVHRMRTLPFPVVVFALALVSLWYALARAGSVSPFAAWFLIAAYGAGYVARVMHGYLVPGRRSWPDAVGTLLVFGFAGWCAICGPMAEQMFPAIIGLSVYLTASALISLGRIVGSLRRYWVWINASREVVT
jgi:phosphatidylglycerophosphate synthase